MTKNMRISKEFIREHDKTVKRYQAHIGIVCKCTEWNSGKGKGQRCINCNCQL